MDRLERIMNRLSDADWGWQPFLFLRPRQDERMGSAKVALFSVFFGPLAAALVMALAFARGQPLKPLNVAEAILAGCALFFVCYRFTFAYFWNRRAERLAQQRMPPTEPQATSAA